MPSALLGNVFPTKSFAQVGFERKFPRSAVARTVASVYLHAHPLTRSCEAALCYDELAAKVSREHNDANVLCLSGDLLGPAMLQKMVETWLATEFSGGRHLRRIKKIRAIEEGQNPREVVSQ